MGINIGAVQTTTPKSLIIPVHSLHVLRKGITLAGGHVEGIVPAAIKSVGKYTNSPIAIFVHHLTYFLYLAQFQSQMKESTFTEII